MPGPFAAQRGQEGPGRLQVRPILGARARAREIFSDWDVEFLFKNAESADEANIEAVLKPPRVRPLRLRASQVCHVRVPRLYW